MREQNGRSKRVLDWVLGALLGALGAAVAVGSWAGSKTSEIMAINRTLDKLERRLDEHFKADAHAAARAWHNEEVRRLNNLDARVNRLERLSIGPPSALP